MLRYNAKQYIGLLPPAVRHSRHSEIIGPLKDQFTAVMKVTFPKCARRHDNRLDKDILMR